MKVCLQIIVALYLACILISCKQDVVNPIGDLREKSGVEVVVLGTVQDAGSPQIGCMKSCCIHLWEKPDPTRKVVSLGIIDYDAEKTYMIEASPDFKDQLYALNAAAGLDRNRLPDGIFLTHAHIGHYTGLMHLGREEMGARGVPVYTMPRMRYFLSNNGPWSQLVDLGNIKLKKMRDSTNILLSQGLAIMPFTVPHRGEYSETCGFIIKGSERNVAFIPDIDKWDLWDFPIEDLVASVDIAYLDATFFNGEELPGRNISEVPHPFVVESMAIFDERLDLKSKINFTHFNHTNPLLNKQSDQYKTIIDKGYNVAQYLSTVDISG